jgi:hypothetical protein
MALEYATLTNETEDPDVSIEVLFNPGEYRLSKDNTFAEAAVAGLGSPLLQFAHGNVATLEMELFFDTYEGHQHAGRTVNPPRGDVRALTQPVFDLMAVDPRTHAPPVVLFAWGGLTFRGVLTRVHQRFTMFMETGIPVRAQLEVVFSELVSPATEARLVKRQTADHTRSHLLGSGETLSGLAARYYDDPGKWRPLAIANQLDELRRLPAGMRLEVPPLPFRDPDDGRVHQ